LTKISAAHVVAHSYDLDCPGCHRPIEISRISRNLAVLAGLIASEAAWYWSTISAPNHDALGWLFPVVFAILAYGIVTPLVLMATADLSMKPETPATESHAPAETAHHGHTPSHH